jgi:hypothetical protein
MFLFLLTASKNLVTHSSSDFLFGRIPDIPSPTSWGRDRRGRAVRYSPPNKLGRAATSITYANTALVLHSQQIVNVQKILNSSVKTWVYSFYNRMIFSASKLK